ncbi:5-dehydro-2-deoxygluconokinase [uncultured Litoreibacter sp.]|uniref:5-dehydro-2-deoxygluconokinase n=1 Tax=uncultured Litoreibacter sp. TaxID=1392394 RepID=UPI002614F6F6|nr:5-dehydro-2-deoxygluconokinase [uncultured Litoreibacter sp.]
MPGLISGILQNDFVVIGRAGMDFFPHPAGTKTEEATEFRSGLGGSAANTAAGICRFGGKADLVTCVSDDSIGRYCTNQLDHYGVGRTHVRSVGGEFRNSLAVYESRVEEHQTVIYRNGAADFEMSIEDVEAIDYGAYGALITAGTVFAAEPSRSAAFRAFELAKAAGLPIIFDIDYRPYSWPSPKVAEGVLSRAGDLADMIVGNDEEFGFMAGDIGKGQAKAQSLANKSAEIVIYKMGEKGAVTYADGDVITTGVYPVTALKPTGAGDSFMAGLMAAIAAGHGLKDAIHRGSACAAIVVGKPGCAPALPNLAELESFLQTHPGPTSD